MYATTGWESLIDLIGFTLLHSLWQVAVIHLGYCVIRWCIPARQTNARYLAGVGAVVLILVSVIATAGVGWNAERGDDLSTSSVMSQSSVGTASDAEAARSLTARLVPDALGRLRDPPRSDSATIDALVVGLASWKPALVTAWVGGFVALAGTQVCGVLAIGRLLRRATTAPADDAARWEQIGRRLGVRGAVRFVTADCPCPLTFGWIKPVVVWPAALTANLTIPQIDAIIAHELAHVRRLDFLINQLQIVMESLLYFHPMAWALSNRVRRDREMCCDVLAVKTCDSWQVLGEALYRVATGATAQSRLTLAAVGGSVVERIAFMDTRRGDPQAIVSTRLVTLLVAAASAVALAVAFDRQAAEVAGHRSLMRTHESDVVKSALEVGAGTSGFRAALIEALAAAHGNAAPDDVRFNALISASDEGIPFDLVWREHAEHRRTGEYPTQVREYEPSWPFYGAGTQRKLARILWRRAVLSPPGVEQRRSARAAVCVAAMRREVSGVPAMATIVFDTRFGELTGCDAVTAARLREHVSLSSDATGASVAAVRRVFRLLANDGPASDVRRALADAFACGDRLPEISYVVSQLLAGPDTSPSHAAARNWLAAERPHDDIARQVIGHTTASAARVTSSVFETIIVGARDGP